MAAPRFSDCTAGSRRATHVTENTEEEATDREVEKMFAGGFEGIGIESDDEFA